MIKEALKKSLVIAAGTTIGGCILPRLLFNNLYNDTYPPLWKQALLYFAAGYFASFCVFLLIGSIRAKSNK